MSAKHYKLKDIILPSHRTGEYRDRLDFPIKSKRGPNFQPKRKKK